MKHYFNRLPRLASKSRNDEAKGVDCHEFDKSNSRNDKSKRIRFTQI
ncbi:hypothetical protein ACWIUD_04320 [Helicobacter sp. 23-1044]